MMTKHLNLFLFIAVLVHIGLAQPTFKIFSIEGTAKVQRSQKKTWDNVKIGDEIPALLLRGEAYVSQAAVDKYGLENLKAIYGTDTDIIVIGEEDLRDY